MGMSIEHEEISVCLIKPDVSSADERAEIFAAIRSSGLETLLLTERFLSTADVEVLYAESAHQPYFPALMNHMTSGTVQFAIVRGDAAVDVLNRLVGMTDPLAAEESTLRRKYGTDILRNALHSSNSNRVNAEISQLYSIAADRIPEFVSML